MATAESGKRALRPRDAADVAEILRSHSGALEPVGGGSKRDIGAPVDADRLDLSALAGIVEYEPAELVLSAHAATPLADVDRELARHGQRLAFEPPDFAALLGGDTDDGAGNDGGAAAGQTLGGVLSANLAGSRRIAAGAARDHFLGLGAVTGDGRPFRAGGKVVKNVTGYDLPKLLAGAWGTLAVLTEVTVRVAPAPETETTLVLEAGAPDAAVELLTRALSSPHEVSAAAFDPAHGAALRIEGFGASVEARVRGVLETLGLAEADVRSLTDEDSRRFWRRLGGAAPLADLPVVWRIGVPPSDASRVIAALSPERYLLDWGGGLIWAGFAALDEPAVRGVIGEGHGHATLWKAPRADRAAVPVFQTSPAVASLAARLKAALDPAGRLNPGRLGVNAGQAAPGGDAG